MVKLGFIRPSQEADLEHASEIWKNLHPEEDEQDENENEENEEREPSTVPVQGVKTTMTAILNFEFEWMLTNESNPDSNLIGTVEEDKSYKLSQKEVAKLHKKFYSLSQNRLDHV